MKGLKILAVVAGFASFAAGPLAAQPLSDQEMARAAAQRGTVIPLPRILADLKATPPYQKMDYLGGLAFDPEKLIYRLKYMDGRRVVFVYVDARSGRVIGRSN